MKKKIDIESIQTFKRFVASEEEDLARAIASKSRKKSESGLKKADKEIRGAQEAKERYFAKLAKYEAEADEAKALIANGGEIVFVYGFTDDYGCLDRDVSRKVYGTLEEATKAYEEFKAKHHGWGKAWIEVRKVGEADRIEKLKTEIAKLKKELNELLEGDY
jgi:hypothetical protein